MNRITQEAKKRQSVVKLSQQKGKSYASRMYGVSLSSVKRWSKRYDGTWQSLVERSHWPLSHPKRHCAEEEAVILKAFQEHFLRYGWDGVYDAAVKQGTNGKGVTARLSLEVLLTIVLWATAKNTSKLNISYLLVSFYLIWVISIDNAENLLIFL